MEFLNFLKSAPSFFNISMTSESGSGVEGATKEAKGFTPYEPQSTVEPNTELFKQQQLINQYMQLNLQWLNQKLQTLEHTEKKAEESEGRSGRKKVKRVNTACGHMEREHYAKGMCSNCYHKYGRNKKPWNCSHDKLYANGMCQNCYINSYNKKRREEKIQNDSSQGKKQSIQQEY